MAKITQVRVSRGALPVTPSMYMVNDGGATIIIRGDETSILRGALAQWVRSHLVEQGDVDGKFEPNPRGGELTVDGMGVKVEGWPAGPLTPEPDLPREPTTVADWRAAIASAQKRDIPPLPPIATGATPAEYAALALTPLGLTIAEVAAAGKLADILTTDLAPEWAVILAAAGVAAPSATPPPAQNPNPGTDAPLPQETANV